MPRSSCGGRGHNRATGAVEVACAAKTEVGSRGLGSAQKVMRAVAKLSDYLGEGCLDHAANNQIDSSFALPSHSDSAASSRQAMRRHSSAANTDTSKVASAKPSPGESPSDLRTADRRVALFFNKEMLRHTHDWPHIEKAERLECAFEQLKKRGLAERCSLRRGRAATDLELLAAHTPRHVEEVRRITARVAADPNNRELREPDGPGGIFYSPAADQAARLASGCVLEATYAVLDAAPQATRSRGGGSSNQTSEGVLPRPSCDAAFALVRPPGHHAGHDDSDGHRAEGFCFFNSACVAARCALETGRARRVAIIDWDIHHGNGTQSILYDDPRALYISLHRSASSWCEQIVEWSARVGFLACISFWGILLAAPHTCADTGLRSGTQGRARLTRWATAWDEGSTSTCLGQQTDSATPTTPLPLLTLYARSRPPLRPMSSSSLQASMPQRATRRAKCV